jgi:hypothetical protein
MSTAAAEKYRRYRARQRTGEIVVRVPVPSCVVEALLIAGRLDDAGSEDREKIAAELAALLAEWARAWRR